MTHGTEVIYEIPLKEEVGTTSWRYVQQGIRKAKKENADIIILNINTYGGSLEYADSIRTAILKCKLPIYAFIDHNAASAGALIAIACDSIFMVPGGSIGAATVVDGQGKVLPDKYQSYMRSMIRSTAEVHGKRKIKTINGDSTYWFRDPLIAEAMVDPRTVVDRIADDSTRVVTLTTQEAIKYGYCEGEASSIKEIATKYLELKNYSIQEYNPTGWDHIWGFLSNPAVQAILIMIIIGGIYFELQSPGLGFPSAAAIIASILYFLPLYMDGVAQNWEIMIFVVGIIALVLEIFVIPGFGIAGISGIILIIMSLIFAIIDNTFFSLSEVMDNDIYTAIFTVIGGIILGIIGVIYISNKIGSKKGIMKYSALQKEQNIDEGYIGVPTDLKALVGKNAETITDLRPSGKIKINDIIYDAVSLGDFIDANTNVKIIKYENAQLYVSK